MHDLKLNQCKTQPPSTGDQLAKLDGANGAIICAVTTAARATIAKPKTGGTRMQPWWTKEYKALRAHTSCLYDIFTKDKTPDNFQAFKKARNDKNKTKRRLKKQSYQADADKLQAI